MAKSRERLRPSCCTSPRGHPSSRSPTSPSTPTLIAPTKGDSTSLPTRHSLFGLRACGPNAAILRSTSSPRSGRPTFEGRPPLRRHENAPVGNTEGNAIRHEPLQPYPPVGTSEEDQVELVDDEKNCADRRGRSERALEIGPIKDHRGNFAPAHPSRVGITIHRSRCYRTPCGRTGLVDRNTTHPCCRSRRADQSLAPVCIQYSRRVLEVAQAHNLPLVQQAATS